MAIYHLSMSNIGARHLDGSAGRSIVAAMAYRTASILVEYITKEDGKIETVVHDYSFKQGVYCEGIIAPEGSTSWVYDKQKLWNRVQAAENLQRYPNARYAKDINIALPNELSLEENRKLVEDLIKKAVIPQGVVAHYAIHNDDPNNIHAHITFTTRSIVGDFFSKKKNLAIDKKAFLLNIRKEAADITNIYLAKNGFDARVSEKSYKDQGIDLESTIHEGWNVTGEAEQGGVSDRMERNEQVRQLNLEKIRANPGILISKLVVGYVKFSNKEISAEISKILNGTNTENYEDDFVQIHTKLMANETLQNMKVEGNSESEGYYDSSLFKQEFTNDSAEEDNFDDVVENGETDAIIGDNETREIVSESVETPRGSVFDDIRHAIDVARKKGEAVGNKLDNKEYKNSKEYKAYTQSLNQIWDSLYSNYDSVFPEFALKRQGRNWVSTNGAKIDGSYGESATIIISTGFAGNIHDWARGDIAVYDYLMAREGCRNHHELMKYLDGLCGGRLIEIRKVDPATIKQKAIVEEVASPDMKRVMNGAMSFFASKIGNIDTQTKSYMSKRLDVCGEGSGEYLMQRGYFGYYDKSFAGELNRYLLKVGIDQETIDKNLDYEAIGGDHRLIMPFRNTEGEAVGFTACDVTRKSKKKYLFSRGMRKKGLLFNLDKVKKGASEIIIVEGQMDSLTMIACGKSNVVALGGSAFNEIQAKLLKDRGVTKVKLCLDMDKAGVSATGKTIEVLKEVGFTDIGYVEHFHGYKDINELITAKADLSPLEKSELLDNLKFKQVSITPKLEPQETLSQEALPQETLPQEVLPQEVMTQEEVEMNLETIKQKVIKSINDQTNYFDQYKVVFTHEDIREAVIIEAGVLSRKMRDEIYEEITTKHFFGIGFDGYGVNWLVRKDEKIDAKTFKREMEKSAGGGFTEDEIEQKYEELLRIPKVAPIDSKLSKQVSTIVDTVIKNLSQNQTCFTEDEIRMQIAVEIERLQELTLSQSLDLIVEAVLTDNSIVKMNRKTLRGEVVYSTLKNIEIEKQTNGILHALNKSDHGHIDNKHLETFLEQFNETTTPPLNDVQKESIRSIVNGDDLVTIQGFPGTGKTTLLEVLNKYNKQYGRGEFYGTSSYGIAALGMEEKSDIKSRTFASLEKRNDYIQEGGTIIVDEAGVLSNADYLKLVEIANNRKCKLVLLGDPLQTQSIRAGASFSSIVDEFGATTLDAIVRQSGWQREASMCFGMGDFTAGLAKYAAADKVFMHRNNGDLIANVVDRYLNDSAKNKAIIVNTNQQVRAINNLVHDRLIRRGEISEEQKLKLVTGYETKKTKYQDFSCGEQIVFLDNDYKLGVRNGMLGTIKSIKGNDLEVELSSGKTIMFNTEKEYGAIDYGYSFTVEKSQGSTFESVYAVMSNLNIGARRAFVMLTRQTKNCEIHADASVFKNIKGLANVIGRDDGKFNASRYDKTHEDRMDSDEYYRNVFYYTKVVDAMQILYKEIERANRVSSTSFDDEAAYEIYKELFKARSDLAFVICEKHMQHRSYLQEAGKVYRDNINAHAGLKVIVFEEEEKYEKELIDKYLQAKDMSKLKLADELSRARVGYIRFYEDEIHKQKIDFVQLKKDALAYRDLHGSSYQNKLLRLESSGYGTDKVVNSEIRREVISHFNEIVAIRDRVGSLKTNIARQEKMIAQMQSIIFSANNFIDDCKGQEDKFARAIDHQKAMLEKAQKKIESLTSDKIYKKWVRDLIVRENRLGRFINDKDFKQLELHVEKVMQSESNYLMMGKVLTIEEITHLTKQAQLNKEQLFTQLSKEITNKDTGKTTQVFDSEKIGEYTEQMQEKYAPFKIILTNIEVILKKESELKQIEIMLEGLKNKEGDGIQKRIKRLNKQAAQNIKLIKNLKRDFDHDTKAIDKEKFKECAGEYIKLITAVDINNLSKYGIGVTKKHHALLERNVLTGAEYLKDRQDKQEKRVQEEITLKAQGVDYQEVEAALDKFVANRDIKPTQLELVVEDAVEAIQAIEAPEEEVIITGDKQVKHEGQSATSEDVLEQPEVKQQYKDTKEEIAAITEELKVLIKEDLEIERLQKEVRINERRVGETDSLIEDTQRRINMDQNSIREYLGDSLKEEDLAKCEDLIIQNKYDELEATLLSYENKKQVKGIKILGMLTSKGEDKLGNVRAAQIHTRRVRSKKEELVRCQNNIQTYRQKAVEAKDKLSLQLGTIEKRKARITDLMNKLSSIQKPKKMDKKIKEYFNIEDDSGGFKMG